MGITDSIKGILSIKLKPRQDSFSDQFCRILMMKIMMIGTLIVGLNWYSDKVNCIIPGSAGIGGGFVSSACWINGLYVYKDIRYHKNDIGYYGIPKDINRDGIYKGVTCDTTNTRNKDGCTPMEKTFYVQYQYLTFIMAVFAAIYYAPYTLFRYCNQDIKALEAAMENDTNADIIVDTYFNERGNSKLKTRLRILGRLLVKILYIIVSVVAFATTDKILLGEFRSFGSDWAGWTNLDNSLAYDYMGKREYPKAGDALLPPFGICDVQESAQDNKLVVENTHRFVCEISQHVLYQYVFVIIWFSMVASIVVSTLGLVQQISEHIITGLCVPKIVPGARQMYKKLTLRECEYLEFMRKTNLTIYGEVLQRLKSYYMPKNVHDEKKDPFISDSYEI